MLIKIGTTRTTGIKATTASGTTTTGVSKLLHLLEAQVPS